MTSRFISLTTIVLFALGFQSAHAADAVKVKSDFDKAFGTAKPAAAPAAAAKAKTAVKPAAPSSKPAVVSTKPTTSVKPQAAKPVEATSKKEIVVTPQKPAPSLDFDHAASEAEYAAAEVCRESGTASENCKAIRAKVEQPKRHEDLRSQIDEIIARVPSSKSCP